LQELEELDSKGELELYYADESHVCTNGKESINADKIVDYLDRFSFNVTKKTVIVLDNASVHRNRKVKELRKIW